MVASKKSEPQIDPRIVLLAQAGDRDSIGSLIDMIQKPLFIYIQKFTRNPKLSEDILQEVLLQIFRKISALNDPLLFKAWAYQIATRTCYKKANVSPEERESIEVNENTETHRGSSSLDLSIDIQRALSEISSVSQTVIVLHYLEGFSLDEVAAILNTPLGTIKSRLNYGLMQLRKKFAQ
jgi:RNA polymerase sigma-70 factor (ECF subfamily)